MLFLDVAMHDIDRFYAQLQMTLIILTDCTFLCDHSCT